MYYMYICIFAYMSTYINDTCICVYVCMYILSHENKKSLNLVHFIIKKTFLIANECKTPIGCLTFIFYQKYFS